MTDRTRLLRRGLLVAALSLAPLGLLGGCAGLVGRDRGGDRGAYALQPGRASPGPRVAWQLVVEQPQAPSLLDRNRIALQRPDGQLAYFAEASWSDRLTALVQSLLLQTFGDSGRIVGLAGDALTLQADYQLRCGIRAFQAVYAATGQAPEIRIALGAQLVRLPQRVAVQARLFEARATAERDGMAAIAAAFDTAFTEIQGALVDWTLDSGEADYRSRG